jgi:hypothetical protein
MPPKIEGMPKHLTLLLHGENKLDDESIALVGNGLAHEQYLLVSHFLWLELWQAQNPIISNASALSQFIFMQPAIISCCFNSILFRLPKKIFHN